MPAYAAPWKSGVHRHASLALLRALLRQTKGAGLDSPVQKQVRGQIQERFDFYRHAQSKHSLARAFSDGYEALALLRASSKRDAQARSRTQAILDESPPRPNRTLIQQQPQPETIAPSPPKPSSTRLPADDPNHILNRPRPTVPGIRRIPKLVFASGYPMLRIKKPQPSSLNAALRHRIAGETRRGHRLFDLQNEDIPEAQNEDEWDQLLHTELGVAREEDNTGEGWGLTWRHALEAERAGIVEKNEEEYREKIARAEKYKAIILEETILAKRERNQRRKERRAARPGEEERLERERKRKAPAVSLASLLSSSEESDGGGSVQKVKRRRASVKKD